MGNRLEDVAVDDGYWKALLHDAERFSEARGPADHAVEARYVRSDEHAVGDSGRPPQPNNQGCRDLDAARHVIRHLTPGQTVSARITKLAAFGAFADLGGFEGLIHVSELAWRRIEHPRDVLILGQSVSAFVISVDVENGRVALSLKRLQRDPWQGVSERFCAGQRVQGFVTSVLDFGAFVRIEADLEGLLHASELGEGSLLHPRNVLRVGEQVTTWVIGVDEPGRRIGLSLRPRQCPPDQH